MVHRPTSQRYLCGKTLNVWLKNLHKFYLKQIIFITNPEFQSHIYSVLG